jgi:hypothetical protein
LGISERCEETAEVIKRYYPWFFSFNCSVVLNRGEISSTNSFPSNIQAEVEKQNALEILAYRFANEVLDVKLQEIGYTHSRLFLDAFKCLLVVCANEGLYNQHRVLPRLTRSCLRSSRRLHRRSSTSRGAHTGRRPLDIDHAAAVPDTFRRRRYYRRLRKASGQPVDSTSCSRG